MTTIISHNYHLFPLVLLSFFDLFHFFLFAFMYNICAAISHASMHVRGDHFSMHLCV